MRPYCKGRHGSKTLTTLVERNRRAMKTTTRVRKANRGLSYVIIIEQLNNTIRMNYAVASAIPT